MIPHQCSARGYHLAVGEALPRLGCDVAGVICRRVEYKCIEHSDLLMLVGRETWYIAAIATAIGFDFSSG